jgi:hypothetical protein
LAAKLREFGCDEVSMQQPKCDIERVAMLKFSDLDRGRRMRSPGRAEFAAYLNNAGYA